MCCVAFYLIFFLNAVHFNSLYCITHYCTTLQQCIDWCHLSLSLSSSSQWQYICSTIAPPNNICATIAPPRSTFGVRKFLCCITAPPPLSASSPSPSHHHHNHHRHNNHHCIFHIYCQIISAHNMFSNLLYQNIFHFKIRTSTVLLNHHLHCDYYGSKW